MSGRCTAGGGLGPVFNARSVDKDGHRTYYRGMIACTKCHTHFQRDESSPTTGVERIPEHGVGSS